MAALGRLNKGEEAGFIVRPAARVRVAEVVSKQGVKGCEIAADHGLDAQLFEGEDLELQALVHLLHRHEGTNFLPPSLRFLGVFLCPAYVDVCLSAQQATERDTLFSRHDIEAAGKSN